MLIHTSSAQSSNYENASEKVQSEPLANLKDIRSSEEIYILWAQNDLLFEVFDVLGRKVLSPEIRVIMLGINHHSNHVSKLTPGIYFYKISRGTDQVSGKFIKQ